MSIQVFPFVILNIAICFVMASLGGYTGLRYLRHDKRSSVLAFVLLTVGISLWQLSNIAQYLVTATELKLLAANFTNAVVVPLVAYSVVWFVFTYTDNDRWANKWLFGVALGHIVVLSTVLVLSPEFLYEVIEVRLGGPVTVLGVTFDQYAILERSLNPSFVLIQLYLYGVGLLTGGVVLRYVLKNRSDLYTSQGVALVVGIWTPIVANGLLFVGLVPASWNMTNISFSITAVALWIAIFRYRMLRVVPVGRHQVVELMADPVVMLDDQERVVDSNAAAQELVEAAPGWRGIPATEFFAPYWDQIAQSGNPWETKTEIIVSQDDREETYDLRVSPLRAPTGRQMGRIVVFRDVTERTERERKLKQQNDRLDQFADLVAHDLRNPLSVIIGRSKLATETDSTAHVPPITSAAHRMEDIITDLLALSRAGQDIDETEPVSLAAVVQDGWANVTHEGATFELDIPADVQIDADRNRLLHVFENLFRNASEHNEAPLTIRVGTLPDPITDEGRFTGFVIEDDGTGIPSDERESIFETGYSTNTGGTGFGLSIVKDIVEAHAWELSVHDSPLGGARFEVQTGNSMTRR